MLKKILRDCFIILGLIMLYASTSPKMMIFFKVARDNSKWWGEFQLTNGDLVNMAHLNLVKKFITTEKFHVQNRTGSDIDKKKILYLVGDSYSSGLNINHFEKISAFNLISLYGGATFHLDTSQNNILIIEIAERNARNAFRSIEIIHSVYDTLKKMNNIPVQEIPAVHSAYNVSPPSFLAPFFNKYINQNLEFNLFMYNFMLPMYETKSALNYYAFNRASGGVVISGDGNFLFLKETIADSGPASSFSTITAKESADIIGNLNTIADYYINCGFKKIFLSVIPNTVSIAQPNGYNNLIPVIQNNQHLRLGIIDVYSAFKESPELYFQKGDTHWTNTGRQKYVELVNNILNKK